MLLMVRAWYSPFVHAYTIERVQTEHAVNTGAIDTHRFISICAGRLACAIVSSALGQLKTHARSAINARIRHSFEVRNFSLWIRLDVPTYERTDVRNELTSLSGRGSTVLWQPVGMALGMLGAAAQLGAQSFALLRVLKGRPDGILMAFTTLATEVYPYLSRWGGLSRAVGASSGRVFVSQIHDLPQRSRSRHMTRTISRCRDGSRLRCPKLTARRSSQAT